jgi:hypothetical protein
MLSQPGFEQRTSHGGKLKDVPECKYAELIMILKWYIKLQT